MNTTEEKAKTTAVKTGKPQKPRGKLPRWGKVLLALAAVLLALAGMAALYVNGKLDLLRYSDGSVSEVGTIDAGEDQDLDATGLVHNDGEMEMPEGSPFADEDVLNILLIGTDERTEAVNDADAFTHLNQLDGTEDTTEFSADARADTLILVSLNIREDTIKLVSIERGTGVPILLDGYEGQYDWITHTFRYGGAKLAMDTVEDCFNVQVDHYVRVNFNSFVQIVDAVGGVDIEITDLEAKALNWEVPSNSMLIVNKVSPGLNHFDGYTALQYARLRKIDNDWKRIERQRTVIAAVLDQIKNASVTELDNLLNTVLPLVQTNFTKSEIAALLVQLPGFLGAEVEQLSMPLQGTYGVRTGMDDRLMYDPDWAVNIKALQDFLYNGETAEVVIAATPETAAAGEETEQEETGAESADDTSAWDRESDPAEEYIRQNLHTVDLAYPLAAADFGSSDYRLFLAGVGGSRDADVQGALAQYLAGQGVRVLAVPDGAAAGVLLDRYLQTGDTRTLEQYLLAHPAAERAQLRAMWQDLYALYPGQLRAVGLGEDQSGAVTGYAVQALAGMAVGQPESGIADVADGIQGSNVRNALYWFERGMQRSPREMERWLGDLYPLALRLYQGLNGTVHTGTAGDLTAYDLQRALETYPQAQILAFVDGEESLQTGDSLASRMAQYLEEAGEAPAESGTQDAGVYNSPNAAYAAQGVCSIGVLYGQWGYDTTFTADDPDTCWNSDGLSSWLGVYITPGRDVLLALDGEDCPFGGEGEPLLKDGAADPSGTAQKLLILHENNRVYAGTAETAQEAS
ncbi:LCP family protein [uncultured Subdoligranulum sp.]|uniref:LCP family protein n=1 Tax=uncultured Subdoligranulum sp. TaxID=512298 RepID=UPI002625E50F|nr:LCP family protein [uncultured Subdoligranulum sp.]